MASSNKLKKVAFRLIFEDLTTCEEDNDHALSKLNSYLTIPIELPSKYRSLLTGRRLVGIEWAPED